MCWNRATSSATEAICSPLLRGFGCRVPVHRHVASLVDNAIEPGADRGEFVEREITLVGDMRVAVKRDVRDRVMAGGEEVVRGEMLLHHAERLIALLHPVLERVNLQLASALHQREPEECRAEIEIERSEERRVGKECRSR